MENINLMDLRSEGYHLLVVKNECYGTFNGYVGVSKEHSLYGVDYEDERLYTLEIHGGITYSGNSLNDMDENYWYFGFDTCHYGDLVPLIEDTKEEFYNMFEEEVKEFLVHLDKKEDKTYKDIDYVSEQVGYLYKQLKNKERNVVNESVKRIAEIK